jgi:hypothetical protein
MDLNQSNNLKIFSHILSINVIPGISRDSKWVNEAKATFYISLASVDYAKMFSSKHKVKDVTPNGTARQIKACRVREN